MTAVPLLVRPLRAEDEPHLLAINRAGTPGVSLLTGAELAESIGLAARFLVAEAEARVIAACPTQHWAIFCP